MFDQFFGMMVEGPECHYVNGMIDFTAAFCEANLLSPYLLLTVNDLTIYIAVLADVHSCHYAVFDSHARNSAGQSDPKGSA